MDYDYAMKMERLNVSNYDTMTMKMTHMMMWKDYGNVS